MERRCKKRNSVASEKPSRCLFHGLPDDLLRLILLQLDSPLWLVRAACVCKRWHRIVDAGNGGRAFLRLARSLHPPVVVGHYNNYFGGHRFVPSSPIPISLSSLDEIVGKSFAHHRTIDRWQVADTHGGLILLYEGSIYIMPNLVVCDPLSRRYQYIRHPPLTSDNPPMCPRVFLLDGDNDGNISISNFRVLYCSYADVLNFYCFSAADGGEWRLVRQSSTTAELNHDKLFCSYSSMGHVIGRIDGSVYLASETGSVIVLDNGNASTRMEVSEVDLPTRLRKSGFDHSTFTIVHGASCSTEPDASATTASIVHVCGNGLELFRQIPSSGKWVLVHSIPQLSQATRGLHGHPEPSRWRAVDIIAGGTRLAVFKVSLSRRLGSRKNWLFSLDVDAMRLQVVPNVSDYDPACAMDPRIIYALPWPHFVNVPE